VKDYCYLYVEDDPFSREVMQMIMEHGLGVTNLLIFESSVDFPQRLKALSRTPDMVLLDIHVQPMDGFEMLRVLRADSAFARTKVVALTASVMNEQVDRLRTGGFDGAISKPLSILTFPDLIQRILSGEEVWHIT
jgi:CheY-like chemotaxis protein